MNSFHPSGSAENVPGMESLNYTLYFLALTWGTLTMVIKATAATRAVLTSPTGVCNDVSVLTYCSVKGNFLDFNFTKHSSGQFLYYFESLTCTAQNVSVIRPA